MKDVRFRDRNNDNSVKSKIKELKEIKTKEIAWPKTWPE
jgi:hypothetical protein